VLGSSSKLLGGLQSLTGFGWEQTLAACGVTALASVYAYWKLFGRRRRPKGVLELEDKGETGIKVGVKLMRDMPLGKQAPVQGFEWSERMLKEDEDSVEAEGRDDEVADADSNVAAENEEKEEEGRRRQGE
jgi:membrane protein implicated in regulation of membrane protease activity